MKIKALAGGILVGAALLTSVGSASALSGTFGLYDGFSAAYYLSKPDLTTINHVDFKASPRNYDLEPATADGIFAPIMDPSQDEAHYAVHIGGAADTLVYTPGIGSVTNYNPSGDGLAFLTWLVDSPVNSPVPGSADYLCYFDLTKCTVIGVSSSGAGQNVSLELDGIFHGQDGAFGNRASSLNLTISETNIGNIKSYSWGGTFGVADVPEPSTMFLMGLGLAMMAAVAIRFRATAEASV